MNIFSSLKSSLKSFFESFFENDSRFEKLNKAYKSLSPEKALLIFSGIFLAVLFFLSGIIVLNKRFVITVPALGGTLTEGIIGTPRFINPVLATSDQDEDFVSLIYAGLTKKDKEGSVILDMASSIDKSEDGLHYDVVIKPTARFHDGKKVIADDIIYTVGLIQDPSIKSPQAVKWEGVSVEKVSDSEITFSLKKPFPLFTEVLSTGILPKHIWKDLTSEQFSLSNFNINAIGSGPFMIDSIENKDGIPQKITLTSHKNYTLGRPYIDKIIINSYQSEKYLLQALDNGEINRVYGITANKALTLSNVNEKEIHTMLLPRTFSIFFNANKKEFLSDKKVRQALNMAINKKAIVENVYKNYGKVLETPFPFDADQGEATYDPDQARATLLSSKYMKTASTTLSLTLATANNEEMRKASDMIKSDWEKIGLSVNVVVYEVSDLNQSVIKDRDFQAMLFASFVEHPSDLYAFWHSSQRNYPGKNISGYASTKLDTALSTLKDSEDPSDTLDAYNYVKKEFADEYPEIPLYSPYLLYINKDKSTTLLPDFGGGNSSRFLLASSWYENTELVWPKTYYKPFINYLEAIIH